MLRTPRHPHEATPDPGLLAHAAVDPAELLADAEWRRTRRRRQRLIAASAAFLTFLLIAVVAAQVGLTGQAPSRGAAPTVAVNAEALGVLVIRPEGQAQRVAGARPVAGASAREQRASAAWTLDGVADVQRATTEASLALGAKRSTAAARAEQVSLFDGRIELSAASLTATAASADGRADGTLELAPSTQLRIDGDVVEATPNRQVAIEGVGTVLINEQAVVSSAPTGDAQTGPRHRVVGALAHVRITQAYRGLPAGTEIVIGRVDAGVREGKVRDTAHPAPEPVPAPVAGSLPAAVQPGVPTPGESDLPRLPSPVRGAAAPAASALVGSLQGYLFPVLGRHDYSNDWGAPRASTGIPHQGTDVFAEEGTPIVAVADGVLDRVGWNGIGGYRFWLFDAYGNAFYHAHLSAFAPAARDGAQVKRGDVIGFVGHTGDAQGTPPHLHFEVHPGNGEPVNPFDFLNGWKQGVAVAIGLLTADTGDRVAPLSLLGFTDIAPNSGLQGSVLDTVPDTRVRPIEEEHAPVDTGDSLTAAIEGPGTSPRG